MTDARTDHPFTGSVDQHALMCDEIDTLRDRLDLLIGSDLVARWIHREVKAGTILPNTRNPGKYGRKQ